MEGKIEHSWKIKNRHLLFIFLFNITISIVFIILSKEFFISYFGYPLASVLIDYFFYLILLLLILVSGNIASINWKLLLGKAKPEGINTGALISVIPLIGISYFAIYLLYYPLSYIVPEFVDRWYISSNWSTNFFGVNFPLENALSFVRVAIFGPAVEVLFLVFILTSIAKKLSINKAIIITSLILSFMGKDLIGSMIFEMVIIVFYLKTKSIIIPFMLNSFYNLLILINVYLFNKAGLIFLYTLKDFQNSLWVPVTGAAIGIPWLVYFYLTEISGKKFIIPYFENAKNDTVLIEE